ncbi:hypothetical protein ACTGU5_11960, partial [Streptococcus suis]
LTELFFEGVQARDDLGQTRAHGADLMTEYFSDLIQARNATAFCKLFDALLIIVALLIGEGGVLHPIARSLLNELVELF